MKNNHCAVSEKLINSNLVIVYFQNILTTQHTISDKIEQVS